MNHKRCTVFLGDPGDTARGAEQHPFPGPPVTNSQSPPPPIPCSLAPRLLASITCPLRQALTVIGVHPVDTRPSILAGVPWAIVKILLTVLTSKTCRFEEGVRRIGETLTSGFASSLWQV